MSKNSFIKKIGKAAKGYYKKYRILPSLCIAQAILESGWGKSSLALECRNYFGMKWVEGCGCKYKTYETTEQKPDGTYYKIYAKFRKYSSLKKGVRGYYEFLQYDRYKNLKGVKDYKKACRLIHKDGWATSLNYSDTLISIIEYNNLQKYDKAVLKSDKSYSNPKNEAKTQQNKSKEQTYKIGDKVLVDGRLYWGGDGSGGHISVKKRDMVVVDVVDKDLYKYYIGVASTPTSARMGWADSKTAKKRD